MLYVKEQGKIGNAEYQKLTGIKKRQASLDLKVLEEKGVLLRVGETGKGTHYILEELQRGKRGTEGVTKGHNMQRDGDNA